MRTVNISLPDNLAKRVDALLKHGEYASRSEMVRTALRVLLTLEVEPEKLELARFKKRPLKEIEKSLLSAGHPEKFVKSVVAGLKKSSVYQ